MRQMNPRNPYVIPLGMLLTGIACIVAASLLRPEQQRFLLMENPHILVLMIAGGILSLTGFKFTITVCIEQESKVFVWICLFVLVALLSTVPIAFIYNMIIDR